MRRVLTLLTVLAGCGLTEPEETRIFVQGTVTAAADGSPIVGATVSAGIMHLTSDEMYTQTSTDDQGHYSLSFVETGYCPESLFWVTASKDGFRDGRITKNRVDYGLVPSGATYVHCTEETQTIDFWLDPPCDGLCTDSP